VTDRSGCGLAELTILRAVAALSAGRGEAVSAEVLDEVDRRIGLGPSYAYPMVCDLSKWWVIPVPLLAESGGAGDRVFPWPSAACPGLASWSWQPKPERSRRCQPG